MEECTRVSCSVWENQRWYPVKGWCAKLLPLDWASWSDMKGKKLRLDEVKIPEVNGTEGHLCEWDGDWEKEVGVGTDDKGWSYGLSFNLSEKWLPNGSATTCIRRRMWVRHAKVMKEHIDRSATEMPTLSDASYYRSEYATNVPFKIRNVKSGRYMLITPQGNAVFTSLKAASIFGLVGCTITHIVRGVIQGYLQARGDKVVVRNTPGDALWVLDPQTKMLWNKQYPPRIVHPQGGSLDTEDEEVPVVLHHHMHEPDRLVIELDAVARPSRHIDWQVPGAANVASLIKHQNTILTRHSLRIKSHLAPMPTEESTTCVICGVLGCLVLGCGHPVCPDCTHNGVMKLREWLNKSKQTGNTEATSVVHPEPETGLHLCAKCCRPSAIQYDAALNDMVVLNTAEASPLVWRVVECYQNHRRVPFGEYSGGALLPTDRTEWSTEDGVTMPRPDDEASCKDAEWVWACPWFYGEWEHRGNWHGIRKWSAKSGPSRFVRRRCWMRLAIDIRSTAQLRRSHVTTMNVPKKFEPETPEHASPKHVWPVGFSAPWVGAEASATVAEQDIPVME